jgi:intergrase/recombinase
MRVFEWWGTPSVAGSWSEDRRGSERVVSRRRRCEIGHLRSWILDYLVEKREEKRCDRHIVRVGVRVKLVVPS